jgi:hypothetical protein
MPTVLRFAGLSVVIYPADHVPSHVHVLGGGMEAVFNLECPGGPIVVRENYGFPRRTLTRIRKMLDRSIDTLCDKWRMIHGEA